jgi:hypothetical protein
VKKWINSRNKVLTVVLALMMALSLFTATAFAVDTDPNMTAYNGAFTVVVNTSASASTANLRVVPADSSYNATYFSTTAAAENVDWSLVGTAGDLSGIYLSGNTTAQTITSGQYYSQQAVAIPANAGAGVASFLAVNTAASGSPSTNITLVVTDEDNEDGTETVSNVTYQIYEPNASGVTILHSGTPATTDAAENVDARSYVTALDGIGEAEAAGIINSYVIGTGNYLTSITVNGTAYAANNTTGAGWQYRVYQPNAAGTVYSALPLSEGLGAGDFALSDGQLVQWRYGAYGISFPDSFPNPGLF